jgi:hypothetical protein
LERQWPTAAQSNPEGRFKQSKAAALVKISAIGLARVSINCAKTCHERNLMRRQIRLSKPCGATLQLHCRGDRHAQIGQPPVARLLE